MWTAWSHPALRPLTRRSRSILRRNVRAASEIARAWLHQRTIGLRHAHADEILPPNDVGRIDAVEIAGVDLRRRNPLLALDDRLTTRKRERIRTEHAAQPGIIIRGVAHIRECEVGVVLATANAEVMPMMRIGAGRDRRRLRDLRSRMRRTEGALHRCRTDDQVTTAQRQHP